MAREYVKNCISNRPGRLSAKTFSKEKHLRIAEVIKNLPFQPTRYQIGAAFATMLARDNPDNFDPDTFLAVCQDIYGQST